MLRIHHKYIKIKSSKQEKYSKIFLVIQVPDFLNLSESEDTISYDPVIKFFFDGNQKRFPVESGDCVAALKFFWAFFQFLNKIIDI